MQLKTILNRVTHYKPLVIATAEFSDQEHLTIEVAMRARSDGQAALLSL